MSQVIYSSLKAAILNAICICALLLDVPLDNDSKIPLVAQELMKKMIHQFAVEYASKCLLRTNINGVSRTSSPLSEPSEAPLDLTVSRTPEEVEPEPGRENAFNCALKCFQTTA